MTSPIIVDQARLSVHNKLALRNLESAHEDITQGDPLTAIGSLHDGMNNLANAGRAFEPPLSPLEAAKALQQNITIDERQISPDKLIKKLLENLGDSTEKFGVYFSERLEGITKAFYPSQTPKEAHEDFFYPDESQLDSAKKLLEVASVLFENTRNSVHMESAPFIRESGIKLIKNLIKELDEKERLKLTVTIKEAVEKASQNQKKDFTVIEDSRHLLEMLIELDEGKTNPWAKLLYVEAGWKLFEHYTNEYLEIAKTEFR